MFDDTMSKSEMAAARKKLLRKSRLSRQEQIWLDIYNAVLDNGGNITATRDYTPPKKRGFWS